MNIAAAAAALVPSVGAGLVFWWVVRALMNADRAERAALARLDAQEASAGNDGPGPDGD